MWPFTTVKREPLEPPKPEPKRVPQLYHYKVRIPTGEVDVMAEGVWIKKGVLQFSNSIENNGIVVFGVRCHTEFARGAWLYFIRMDQKAPL